MRAWMCGVLALAAVAGAAAARDPVLQEARTLGDFQDVRAARSLTDEEDFAARAQASEEDFPGARILKKLYNDCAHRPSAMDCLKGKAVTFFDRADRQDEVPLGEFAALVRESRADAGRSLGENEVESAVAAGGSVLDNLLFDRVARFLDSRSLRLALPKVSGREIARGLEEGRGKMKKMMSMMMMMVMMKKMMLLPIAIIALFLLAGKAFIISKIALILALIITLKKVLASKMDDHHEVAHGGHSGGWDRRSFSYSADPAAHDLAYRAYAKAL